MRILIFALATCLLSGGLCYADDKGEAPAKPTLNPFKKRADKAKAKAVCMNLKNAVLMYNLQYGKLPIGKGAGKDLKLETKGYLIRILVGHNADDLNPRKLKFIKTNPAKGGRGGSTTLTSSPGRSSVGCSARR